MRGNSNFAAILVLAFLTFSTGCFAQNVQTISGEPSVSPSGKYSAVVDRLLQVRDGEPDKFSGDMMLRILDTASSTVMHQQFVEGTQVRTLDAPTWLDDTWCAYVYNVAKNANGMVYFDAPGGNGYQLEMVAPPRRMGATNSIEQELTSLDVTVLGTTSTYIHNVPWKGGTAFPLHLDPLPLFARKPFGTDFLHELQAAVHDYMALCHANHVTGFDLEQATESFNDAENFAAVLACADAKPMLCLVPLQKGKADTRVIQLESDVTLNCAKPSNEAAGKTPAAADPTDYTRFTTSWKNNETAQVECEVFSAESETSHRVTYYVAQLDGTVKRVPHAAVTPPPAVAVTPRHTTSAPEDTASHETAATSHTRPLLKVTTHQHEASSHHPESETHHAQLTPESPLYTPDAVLTPTPAVTKHGLFDRILPHRPHPAPTIVPAPAEPGKTPSE